MPASGVVLADQITSLDWQARKAEFFARAPAAVLQEVLAASRPGVNLQSGPVMIWGGNGL